MISCCHCWYLNIHNCFVPVTLALSPYVSCSNSYTYCSSTQRMLFTLPHSRTPLPTSGIRARGTSTRCWPSSVCIQTTFLICFPWRTEKRKTFIELHLTVLNHCWSRLVGCTSPCDCNHSKWALCATSDSIVLHPAKRHSNRSLDAIHLLVVTTRSRLVSREQPQSVLHSVERHSGGPVGSVPLIVAVIRSRIGLNNRYLVIGIRHTIGS